VRELLGLFSLDSMDLVSQALLTNDARKMLDIVAELEANGRSLQHFARELARYFRNLLVAKVAGASTRLIAASPAEQKRLADVAAQFTEEDLARDLKLSLDLFRDLQSSLQPRLHLEMGLLRLVHAAKLIAIEDAIASLGSQGPAARVQGPVTASPLRATAPPATPGPQPSPAPAASGDFRSRLHAALVEEKRTFLADAVEHSDVTESAAEITFTTSKMWQMNLKDAALEAVVKRLAGRPVRIAIKVGEVAAAPAPQSKPKAAQGDAEAAERALSHPEVKRFQELFPGQVRTVRNLKETES
jgi:DNA polymerase-3 subunit gamma/tau